MLSQGNYNMAWSGIEPATSRSRVRLCHAAPRGHLCFIDDTFGETLPVISRAHFFFFVASTCLGDFVQVASPSSPYNPTLTSRWVSWDNRNSPASSQVSAPSKLRIVTSKSELVLRHVMLLL